jgi:hypothetical protein
MPRSCERCSQVPCRPGKSRPTFNLPLSEQTYVVPLAGHYQVPPGQAATAESAVTVKAIPDCGAIDEQSGPFLRREGIRCLAPRQKLRIRVVMPSQATVVAERTACNPDSAPNGAARTGSFLNCGTTHVLTVLLILSIANALGVNNRTEQRAHP